ncbi:hypothetical protein BH24CHL1_BH24CHL1_01930 [soil metagenome]
MKNPRFWIGMIVSAVALAVAWMRVDLDEALGAFGEAEYVWLIPAVGFAIGSLVFRTARWRALFYPLELRMRQLFGILTVGYTVTAVLPLRLGDVARAHLVGQIHRQSRVRTLSTVAVEHLMDVVAVLVILLALAPFVAFPDWARTATWAAAAIVIASGALIAVLWQRREQSLAGLVNLFGWLPEKWTSSLRDKLDAAIDGFSALESRQASAQVVAWSALTWLSGGFMMWAVLVAFGLPHSFQAAMFLVAVSAIAMTVPSSPGFVGVYHALIIEAATLVLGFSSGSAASFAVMTHLLLFLPPVVLGIAYMVGKPDVWNELLRWRRDT